MKIKHVYIIAALALAGFSGCKKDSSNKSTTPSSSSYFPVTAGSSWVYDDTPNGGSAATVTVTMTGSTSVINGKTYYAYSYVSSSTGSQSGYYYNSNHEFATRGTSTSANVTLEIQEGNDAQAAGYNWTTMPTDDGTVGGYPAQTINTIKEKNITKVVNGKTFNNVIHTAVSLQYDLGSGFETVANYDIYLAPGVGMIETDNVVEGQALNDVTIKSYTIK